MIFVKNSRGMREVNMINTVKNKFVNKVGGRGVNLNLDNVSKYTVCVFLRYPFGGDLSHNFFNTHLYGPNLLYEHFIYKTCSYQSALQVSRIWRFAVLPDRSREHVMARMTPAFYILPNNSGWRFV